MKYELGGNNMSLENQFFKIFNMSRGSLTVHEMMAVTTCLAYIFTKDPKAKSQLAFKGKDEAILKLESISCNASSYTGSLRTVGQTFDSSLRKLDMDIYKMIVDSVISNYDKDNFSQLLIKTVSSFSGKNEVENSTPDMLNQLMIRLAEIQNDDKLLDPSVGYGSALLEVISQNPEQVVVGQEINPEVAELAQMLLEIAGAKEATVFSGDTLVNPQYLENGELSIFDKVITVPPFSIRLDRRNMSDDPFNQFPFGSLSRSSADWAFISNAISSTKIDGGKSVVMVPTGALYRGGADKSIRQRLLDYDYFEAIISLPPKLLMSTAIPVVLLIFNRDKDDSRMGKVQFIKVNEDQVILNRALNELSEKAIDTIVDAYQNFSEVEGFSKIVSRKQIDAANMAVEQYIVSTNYTFDGVEYDVNLKGLDESNSLELGQIADINRGFNLMSRNETEDGKYRVLKISDLKEGVIDYSEIARANVDEGTKVDNYLLENDDLILSIRGTTNKVAIIKGIEEPTLINPNLVRIRLKNKSGYLPEFIQLFMESPVGLAQLESISMGTTIRQIPIRDLREYRVPMISLEQQQMMLTKYRENNTRIMEKIAELNRQKEELKSTMYQEMNISDLFKEI